MVSILKTATHVTAEGLGRGVGAAALVIIIIIISHIHGTSESDMVYMR